MMFRLSQGKAVILAGFLVFASGFAAGEQKPPAEKPVRPFAIVFKKSKVQFSGTIDSKETADKLASTALSVRPEMSVVNAGMDFNAGVEMPEITLLQSLLLEVALSTEEGVLEISKDQLVVGGLTDSVVAESVLRLRAKPLLDGRVYRQRTCLVPVEDLPEVPVLLSTGETRKAFRFDLEPKREEEAGFEPPGILLTKIRSLIEGTADPSIFPEEPAPGPIPQPTVVEIPKPLEVPEEIAAEAMEEQDSDSAEPTPAPDVPSPYIEMGPILFARNSYVLQAGQRKFIEEDLATKLKAEPWNDKEIIVRSLIYSSGSDAYSSWVSVKRMNEAVRLLSVAGIHPNFLKAETMKTTDRIDKGEVQLLIKRPPGYVDPPEEEVEEEER